MVTTPEQDFVLKTIESRDVHFVRFWFTDVLGNMKSFAVVPGELEAAFENGMGFDASCIEGFSAVSESDMLAFPDPSTFQVLPWRPQANAVARMICNIRTPEGAPYEGDPRSVLDRMVRKAADMGYVFNVGPELEFFLFELDEDGHATTCTHDEAGYFDLGPLDHGEATRREISHTLEQMGFEIEASHHECAVAQHEIDFKYNNALDGADKIMTFKLVAKSIAQKNHLHATFMPKPIYDIAGNGMHLNMSLFKDGKNVFHDPSGERGLSKAAYSFIAGLLDHVQGFTAVTNPLVNSYKRLGAGHEAPRYRAWSASNRSALIRIPAARGQATRVELRSPDPSCNPYLAVAVCLAAGLDGISRGLTPPPEITGDIYAMDDATREKQGIFTLPDTLKDALEELEKDVFILDVLGEHVTRQFIKGRLEEWNEYQTRVSSWELEKYLVIY